MKSLKLTAVLIALTATIGSALAAPTSVYLRDSNGGIAKSSNGLCWRTGYWNPIDAANDPAVCECDAGAVSELVCKRDFAPMPQVQQAPQTRPALPVRPVAKQPQRITLSEDISFKFNQYVLQDKAKNELDNVVLVANEVNAERIIITGHTDRIGSESYNKVLSQKRAEAVKNYLVRQGLPYNMIQASGAGEAMPLTGNTCNNLGKENYTNKKLVDCLAPDRRVDIDIYGNK